MKIEIVKARKALEAAARRNLKQIVDLYERGRCPAAIAAQLELTKFGVRAVLIAAGYSPRSRDAETLVKGEPHRNKPTAESLAIDAEQKRLYESGKTMQEIAKQYGTSKQAVQQRLKRAGAAMRQSGGTKGSGREYACGKCGAKFRFGHRNDWSSLKYCSPECSKAAGRNSLKGSQVGSALLNDDKVLEIRRRLAAGERGTDLAAEFLVKKATISAIKAGRTWRHLL